MSEIPFPEEFTGLKNPKTESTESQEIGQEITQQFPYPEKVFRTKNKDKHLDIYQGELTAVPTEQAPLSVFVSAGSAASVPENTNLITSRQYGCLVAVIFHENRRLLAHVTPNLKDLGFMYNGYTPEEQERLTSETAQKISNLLGGELTGAKGILFANIASEVVFPEKHEYHYENQTALWQRLQNKLQGHGAQIGIVESPLDHTAIYVPANSNEILLTGYKATNAERFGEVVVEQQIEQKTINLDEACSQTSLLPHKARKSPISEKSE